MLSCSVFGDRVLYIKLMVFMCWVCCLYLNFILYTFCEGFIVDTLTSYSTFTLDGYVYISRYF